MTSGKTKSSYVVKFAQTEADQDLLQAVEQALSNQPEQTFSNLCKQALRQMLASDSILPMLAILEQQVMTLQLQMSQFEQRRANQLHQPAENIELQQQMQALSERVAQLEQQIDRATSTSEPTVEPDPLLSRLAPLLEDF